MHHYINNRPIILEISGKDARRYLNARLSNNIKTLNFKNFCFAAALSPQGKTEGYFTVFCINNDQFIVCCDGGDKDQVIAALLRYKVADRLEVKYLSENYKHIISFYNEDQEYKKIGFSKDLDLSESVFGTNGQSIIYLSKRGNAKCLEVISPDAEFKSIEEDILNYGSSSLSEYEFKLLNIKSAYPLFPDQLEKCIFSASGLDFAVSFKKGCYVGQEVIEKIDAYGKVPYLIKAIEAKKEAGSSPLVTINSNPLPADKILGNMYDNKNDKTYLFLELKNTDNILDSEILINNNKAKIIC